jgi:hypothetical protein
MIFLAVTLGFFAEQIRERYVEKERLYNYFASMVLDMKGNMEALDSATAENAKMIAQYDAIVKSFLSGKDTLKCSMFRQQILHYTVRNSLNGNI